MYEIHCTKPYDLGRILSDLPENNDFADVKRSGWSNFVDGLYM